MFGVPYHFLAIHFPVVLISLALFYDLRGFLAFGYRLTLGAAAAALIAAGTGFMQSGGQLSRMTIHAAASLIGTLCIVALAMLRYSQSARDEDPLDRLPAAWLILEIAGGAGIIIAAFTGHRAVLGLY